MNSHDNTPKPHEANNLGDWIPPDTSGFLVAGDDVNKSTCSYQRRPSQPNHCDDFKVAIICALPLEARPVIALFEETWNGKEYGKAPGDSNTYSFGLIGHHNVVLVHMPNMGKIAATEAAVSLRTSFRGIKLALLVGICGGVPLGEHHSEIFLGDVVISDGIIQYDFGRRLPNNIFAPKDNPRDNLPRPTPEVRTILAKLKSGNSLQDKFFRYLHEFQQQPGTEVAYPGASEDRLFKSAYQHKHREPSECAVCSGSNICDEALKLSCKQLKCDQQEVVSRVRSTQPESPHTEWRPAVHFGLFASGDTVMKSGVDRDAIAAQDGTIAFEMEGAGVWNPLHTICTLVIKGVCDYADSHKNKRWQHYAAATAAAATKAFLEEWHISFPERQSSNNSGLLPKADVQRDEARKTKERVALRKLDKSAYEMQKNRNPRRTEGTCMWFVAHKRFREWQENRASTTLWVSADPGCGKSVLARHLIDSVLLSTESRTTCYFFFKDDFEDQNNVVNAICCILHQLFKKKRFLLSEAVLELFEIYTEDITGSFSRLWSTLLSVAKDSNAGEIVCILDAVDECEESGRSQLAEALSMLYHDTEIPNLKFLLTSRPHMSIRRGFKRSDVPELSVIHLSGESDIEATEISKEIDVFIKAKVQSIQTTFKLDDSEGNLLLDRLMQIPHRTYLWVYLTLDLIETSMDMDLDKARIAEATSHLPTTVEKAYERILSRSRDLREARKLLHIVVAASRPLTLKEMELALTLKDSHRSYNGIELKAEDRFRENVRELCGLFVVVRNSKIYLLHQTAREFLVRNGHTISSENVTISPEWKQSLRPQVSHRILAEICIWHLLFAEFETDPINEDEAMTQNSDKYVFLDYSAKYWTTHLQESQIKTNDPLVLSALRLCDATSRSCLSWLKIYWSTTNTNFPLNFTPLMITSYFGLTEVTKILCNRLDVADLDFKDGTYERSALSWAAGNGFHNVVKLLVKGINRRRRGLRLPFTRAGAQVDSVDRDGLTPLSHAILNSHVITADLLLKAGARADRKDGIGGTPLSYAICNGYDQMIELLFKGGTNIDSEEDISAPLLLSAAKKGHEDIVRLLLDRGRVDPNSKDTDCETPLSLAIRNRHKSIINLLINNQGTKIIVTKEAVNAAVDQQKFGKEVMISLLDLQRGHLGISEEAVSLIIEKFDKAVVVLLLKYNEKQVIVTEHLLLRIADREVLTLLLNSHKSQVTILPEAVFTIISRFDKETITLLLNQYEDSISITEDLLLSLTHIEVVALLLNRDNVAITEDAVLAIITSFGEEMIVLLLDRHGDKITITAKIASKINDKKLIILLLDRHEGGVAITGDALSRIIGRFDSEVAILLLNRCRDQITVTKEAVSIILEKFDREMIFRFLGQPRDRVVMTEEARLVLIAQCDGEVIALLLELCGHKHSLTEKTFEAAAQNWMNGKEAMKLVCNGGERSRTVITKKIFNAAAQNRISGKEAMAVLCNWRGKAMTSEEKAFQAMAERWKSIEDILPSFESYMMS